MRRRFLVIKVVFLATLFFSGQLRSDAVTSVAQATAGKYQNAVVHIKLLAKIKVAGRDEQDQKIEVLGTVIDPSGLTVVSARSIDPAAMMKSVMKSIKGAPEMTFDSELSQTVIVKSDGSELPAEIVMKDPELDLALIQPKKSDGKFEFVPFIAQSKSLMLLDDVFVLSRLSRSENRAIALTRGNVRAVVKTPRLFYITTQDIALNLGCPVFAHDGTPVGIIALREKSGADESQIGVFMNMMTGGAPASSATTAVLRPNSDVLDILNQAKTQKKETP